MSGILFATALAVHSTYHIALQASPEGQLVFGQDMIFKYIAGKKRLNKENKR